MKREGPWPAFDLVMGVLWTVVVIVRVWERAGLAVILLCGILALFFYIKAAVQAFKNRRTRK